MNTHLPETLLALTLFYNILDAMRSLNKLSTLASPMVSPTFVSARPRAATTAAPHIHTPVRSSPKTRASPSVTTPASPSTPLFRASAMASPTPPSPKTPSAMSNTPSAVLRRSFMASGAGHSPTTGSPLANVAASAGATAGESFGKGSPVAAYRARHSPVACESCRTRHAHCALLTAMMILITAKMTVNSQDAIDKMFD